MNNETKKMRRIEKEDLLDERGQHIGVKGQPDTPELSAAEMQEAVEAIPRKIVERFNENVEAFERFETKMDVHVENDELHVSVVDRIRWNNSGGKCFASLVIGNTRHGYTENDVDILWDRAADAAGVQQAINDLSARGGGKVILLDGTYSIQNFNLIISSNITFEGMGAGSTRVSGSSPGVISPFISVNGNNSIIRDIEIDNTANSVAVSIMGVNNTVENCVISSMGTMAAIQITGGAILTRIIDNTINGLDSSIQAAANVNGNTIRGNWCSGDIRMGVSAVSISNNNNIAGNAANLIVLFGNGSIVVGNNIPNGVAATGINNIIESNGGGR